LLKNILVIQNPLNIILVSLNKNANRELHATHNKLASISIEDSKIIYEPRNILV
jgi:hypothetical protein